MTASAASPTSCTPLAALSPQPRHQATGSSARRLQGDTTVMSENQNFTFLPLVDLDFITALMHSGIQALRHPGTQALGIPALRHSGTQYPSPQALRIQALRHSGTQTLGHTGIPHTTLAGRSRSSSCHYSLNILHTHLCSCRLGSALSLPRRPKPILVLLRSSSTPSMFRRPKPILACHHFLKIFSIPSARVRHRPCSVGEADPALPSLSKYFLIVHRPPPSMILVSGPRSCQFRA